MLSPYEVRFAEAFLAELAQQEMTSFPFGSEAFTSGVRSMAKIAKGDESVREYKIGYLFRAAPDSGEYSRFLSALNYLNGNRISLENPRLVTARLKIADAVAASILEDTPPKLRNLAQKAAKQFKETLECGA